MAKRNYDQDLDLNFLLERRSMRKKIFTDKKIGTMVRYAKIGCTNAFIAKKLKVSLGAVVQIFRELKNAAKEGYTLKKYLSEGRPLKPKNKVIAK